MVGRSHVAIHDGVDGLGVAPPLKHHMVCVALLNIDIRSSFTEDPRLVRVMIKEDHVCIAVTNSVSSVII
jgi:hypothetical protein